MRMPSAASWIINGWASRSNCELLTNGYNGWRIRTAGSLMLPATSTGWFLLRIRHFSCLAGVDPHGETGLGPGQMRQLVAEVDLLLTGSTVGAERRGLMRLRAMAVRCAEEHGELVFVGD